MNTRLTGRALQAVRVRCARSASLALSAEVSATSPSTPAVRRPALRCVTCRTLTSVFDRLRNISFCKDRTLAQSPACVALKILCRSRRTFSSWHRQSAESQSGRSPSGPFTLRAAIASANACPVIVPNLPFGSGGRDRSPSKTHPVHVSTLSGPGTLSRIRPVIQGGRQENATMLPGFPVTFRHAGICFLDHPVPAGEFSVPHGRPAGRADATGPRRGSHVPLARDTTGEGALYAPGAAVSTRPGKCPQPPPAASQRPAPAPRQRDPSAEAHLNEASSRVHSRSPVRSSPHLWPPDGAGTLGLEP
jgi:hypothetical protein